jgi:hypothetical protein
MMRKMWKRKTEKQDSPNAQKSPRGSRLLTLSRSTLSLVILFLGLSQGPLQAQAQEMTPFQTCILTANLPSGCFKGLNSGFNESDLSLLLDVYLMESTGNERVEPETASGWVTRYIESFSFSSNYEVALYALQREIENSVRSKNTAHRDKLYRLALDLHRSWENKYGRFLTERFKEILRDSQAQGHAVGAGFFVMSIAGSVAARNPKFIPNFFQLQKGHLQTIRSAGSLSYTRAATIGGVGLMATGTIATRQARNRQARVLHERELIPPAPAEILNFEFSHLAWESRIEADIAYWEAFRQQASAMSGLAGMYASTYLLEKAIYAIHAQKATRPLQATNLLILVASAGAGFAAETAINAELSRRELRALQAEYLSAKKALWVAKQTLGGPFHRGVAGPVERFQRAALQYSYRQLNPYREVIDSEEARWKRIEAGELRRCIPRQAPSLTRQERRYRFQQNFVATWNRLEGFVEGARDRASREKNYRILSYASSIFGFEVGESELQLFRGILAMGFATTKEFEELDDPLMSLLGLDPDTILGTRIPEKNRTAEEHFSYHDCVESSVRLQNGPQEKDERIQGAFKKLLSRQGNAYGQAIDLQWVTEFLSTQSNSQAWAYLPDHDRRLAERELAKIPQWNNSSLSERQRVSLLEDHFTQQQEASFEKAIQDLKAEKVPSDPASILYQAAAYLNAIDDDFAQRSAQELLMRAEMYNGIVHYGR